VKAHPEWCTARSLFSREQIEAVAHALQNPLSLVQGCPGSGKSFLGVWLVRILLSAVYSDCETCAVCGGAPLDGMSLSHLEKHWAWEEDGTASVITGFKWKRKQNSGAGKQDGDWEGGDWHESIPNDTVASVQVPCSCDAFVPGAIHARLQNLGLRCCILT
jgi:hypothetical protein